MMSLEAFQGTYSVDLTLRPTTFDFWHVCLAGTVVVLMLLLIFMLLAMLLTKNRNNKTIGTETSQPTQPIEPTVKIIEKIVEVEKVVPAPEPEPVILREYTPDAALQVLGILQKEARFIDFIKEDLTHFSDTDIGVAARVVHDGCNKVINEYFKISPIRNEAEGSNITVPADFDASTTRLAGNIVGVPPFTGSLVHKGWQANEVRLPKLTQGHNPHIIAPAEIEL